MVDPCGPEKPGTPEIPRGIAGFDGKFRPFSLTKKFVRLAPRAQLGIAGERGSWMKEAIAKEICFYFPVPITSLDFKRFGIETLRAHGFNVKLCDMTRVFYPHYLERYQPLSPYAGPDLTVLRTRSDVPNFLKANRNALAILVLTLEPNSMFFYRMLKRFNISYLQFYSENIPMPKLSRSFKDLIKRGIHFRSVTHRLSAAIFRHCPNVLLGLQPPRYILKGGGKDQSNCPRGDGKTEIIWGHSLDYDLYLSKRDEVSSSQKWCVYLDEYFPFHPDLLLEGESLPFLEPRRYFSRLNDFFSRVETEVGLPVVIAAHPRSQYNLHPDYFEERRVEKGKTVDLVAQAKCVFTHFSTSINFAVLFRKPILFLTSDEINTKRHAKSIFSFAAEFGKKPFNIDRDFRGFEPNDLKVSETLYADYQKNYIKTAISVDKPLWTIVADRLGGR